MAIRIRLEITSPNYSRGKGVVREICEKALEANGWTKTRSHYSFHSQVVHFTKLYEEITGGKTNGKGNRGTKS